MGGNQSTLNNTSDNKEHELDKIKLNRDKERERDTRNPRKIQSKLYRQARNEYKSQIKQENDGKNTLAPPPVKPIKAISKPNNIRKSHYDMVKEALDIEFDHLNDDYSSDQIEDEMIPTMEINDESLDSFVEDEYDAESIIIYDTDEEDSSVSTYESDRNVTQDDDYSDLDESDYESSVTSSQDCSRTYSTIYFSVPEITDKDDQNDSYGMVDLKALRRTDRYRDHENATKIESREYRLAKSAFERQSKEHKQGDELEQPLVKPTKNSRSRFFMEKKPTQSKFEMVRDAVALSFN